MTDIPDGCIAGAFRIAADGTWFHEGAPIRREALVRLFASVLVRDADGAYWLETPAEKVPVRVDDAPFVAVELAAEGRGEARRLSFRTNAGRWVALGPEHPLAVRRGTRGPKPYLDLGGGLEALIARPVYYELAALAVPGPEGGGAGVWSGGRFFPLDPAGEDGAPP